MQQLHAVLFTLLLLFLSACNNPTSSQSNGEGDFPNATQVTLEMGTGINLGNVFDLGAHRFDFFELASIIATY